MFSPDYFDPAYFDTPPSLPDAPDAPSDSPYFDCAYFDTTYFDASDDCAPVTGGNYHATRRLPVPEDDELFALI